MIDIFEERNKKAKKQLETLEYELIIRSFNEAVERIKVKG